MPVGVCLAINRPQWQRNSLSGGCDELGYGGISGFWRSEESMMVKISLFFIWF